jgi:hypothetical protein
MTVYSLVLFVHVGAALALASVLSIDALILFQFRRATSPTRANLQAGALASGSLDSWRFGPSAAPFGRILGRPNVRLDARLAKSGFC